MDMIRVQVDSREELLVLDCLLSECHWTWEAATYEPEITMADLIDRTMEHVVSAHGLDAPSWPSKSSATPHA